MARYPSLPNVIDCLVVEQVECHGVTAGQHFLKEREGEREGGRDGGREEGGREGGRDGWREEGGRGKIIL